MNGECSYLVVRGFDGDIRAGVNKRYSNDGLNDSINDRAPSPA